jgi:hypothetical protein
MIYSSLMQSNHLKPKYVVSSHGLGNQLFQLCFAHFLRIKYQKVIFENNPIFPKGHYHELGEIKQCCSHLLFKQNTTISHENLLGRFLFRTSLATKYRSRLLRESNFNIFTEDSNNYFKFDLNNFTDNSLNDKFVGFWQNWRYLYHVGSEFLDEILTLIHYKCIDTQLISKTRNNLVVHIRHGDYLERGLTETFGIISIDSYKELISKLKIENPKINVITLTDVTDPVIQSNFGKIFGVILGPDKCNKWQAMNLMSRADYLVAANSTFSWWGAALALHNGGTSFIPNRFFKNLDTHEAFKLPGLKTYQNGFR